MGILWDIPDKKWVAYFLHSECSPFHFLYTTLNLAKCFLGKKLWLFLITIFLATHGIILVPTSVVEQVQS